MLYLGLMCLLTYSSICFSPPEPGKVSNLSVSDNTMTSLLLSWRPPEGHYDYFLVKAMFDSNKYVFVDTETYFD